MKFKALLVLFVGFLTSTSFCQAQSIWHPSYLTGASGLSNSKLERIEIKRKTTALVFALSAYEGEITLPKDVCLKAAGDSLPLLSAVAYKHKYNENSARQVAKGETFAFQEGDSLYGAQNEAYMSRSAEKWARDLCFNELGVCS